MPPAARPRSPPGASPARSPSPSRRAWRPRGFPCSRAPSPGVEHQPAATDRVVADPYRLAVLIEIDARGVCVGEPGGEVPPSVDRLDRAHVDPLADDPPVVLRPHQRPLDAR